VDSDCAALLRSQLGIITWDQSGGVGLSSSSLARRVERGELDRILPAVYRHAAAHRSPEQFILAVAAWIGDAGALSHLTSARLSGMERIPDDGLVHVVTPHRSARPHPAVRVARAPLPDEHVVSLGVLRVTSPERTIVDIAAMVSEARLISAIESAFRLSLTTPTSLRGVVAEMGTRGRKHAGRIVRWLDARGGGPALQSELEVVTWRALEASGLPLPVRQHRVQIDSEPFDLDFAWPDEHVAVESDGWSSHGGRLPFDDDRVRRAAIESVGWRIIPVTWTEIHQHRDRFLARVATALRSGPLHSGSQLPVE
jgi:very-short-patch-repair endonuclease